MFSIFPPLSPSSKSKFNLITYFTGSLKLSVIKSPCIYCYSNAFTTLNALKKKHFEHVVMLFLFLIVSKSQILNMAYAAPTYLYIHSLHHYPTHFLPFSSSKTVMLPNSNLWHMLFSLDSPLLPLYMINS